eukprot:CCRYP_004145-RA/>CCRYP_004145-RA protein AED:0.00 eAED:0.00 QI:284/1/1/1/1/1/2/690/600
MCEDYGTIHDDCPCLAHDHQLHDPSPPLAATINTSPRPHRAATNLTKHNAVSKNTMIRARIFLVSKSHRLQREVQRASHSSTARFAATSTVLSSDAEWTSSRSMAGAAVTAAAAGVILSASSMDGAEKKRGTQQAVPWRHPSSVAQCEAAPYQDDSEKSSVVRTISLDEITQQHQKEQELDNKSMRAYSNAVEHDLFQEELVSSGMVVTNSNNNNAITERFVSFSPVSEPVSAVPKISVRHTHRHSSEDEADEDEDEATDNEEQLLATSTDVETPPVVATTAKTYNTTLGSIAKDATPATPVGDPNSVILRKLKTVRRTLGEDQVYTKRMYFYKHDGVKDSVRAKFRLFALPSSESLGKEMAYLLDTELNCIDVGSYSDGETSVQIGEAVRGKNVFVVCTTSTATSIAELLLTLSALRRGSAKRICAVIPYYGYSRQDRRTGMKREPIAAADMAKLLEEMGVDSVICVDLHNALVKGFFSPGVPVDHLSPGPVAAAYFYEELFGGGEAEEEEEEEKKEQEPKEKKKVESPKITVVAAHENQVNRANVFRNALMKLSGSDDIRVALISNSRALKEYTMSDNATIVGDVAGRQCIIVRSLAC